MSNWQPIDTAPKDGTWILAYGLLTAGGEQDHTAYIDPPGTEMLMVMPIKWEETWWEPVGKPRTFHRAYWAPYDESFLPTHWMPLPDPPTTEA